MAVAFGVPSRAQVTTCEGITPCMAALISSGSVAIVPSLSHSGPGAGSRRLDKDLLDPEGDRDARLIRDAEGVRPGDLFRKHLSRGCQQRGPVGILARDIVGG